MFDVIISPGLQQQGSTKLEFDRMMFNYMLEQQDIFIGDYGNKDTHKYYTVCTLE